MTHTFEPMPSSLLALCHLHSHHHEVPIDDAGRFYVRRSDGKGRTAGPFEAHWQAEVILMAEFEADVANAPDGATSFQAKRRMTVARVLTGRAR